MPLAAAIVPAVIGAGASIYSAESQKSAAKKSLAAQQAAQAQARADAQAAQQTVTNLQNPYLTGGNAAYSSLVNRIVPGGGGQPSAQPGSAGGAAAPSAPSYSGYLAANPDLAAEAQRTVSSGQFPNEAAYLQWHDQTYGNEGRNSYADPTAANDGAAPAGQQSDPTADPFAPQPWDAPTDYGAAPRAPGLSAIPGAADISGTAFQASPLYGLGLSEGQRNLNSNYGARGLLRSGAAIKGALDFARENVKNNYSTFANTAIANNQQAQYAASQGNNQALNLYTQTANQYNNDRNFGYGQYTDSLNYNNNRYDATNSNLFKLAGTGIDAANNIGNAATNVANTNGNLALAGGQSASNYYDAVGGANSQLAGSLAGIGTSLINGLGGSRTGTLTPVTTQDPIGYGSSSQVNPYNPTLINTPAKIRVF